MATKIVSLLLLLGLSSAALGPEFLYDGKPDAKHVIEYHEGDDYKSLVAVPRVVEFYSPYCGHCINFAPKYMELADKVTEQYPDVKFYAVSCKAHKDVCKDSEIRGYPSFHIYPAGSSEGTYLKPTENAKTVIKALDLDKDAPSVKTGRTLKSETTMKKLKPKNKQASVLLSTRKEPITTKTSLKKKLEVEEEVEDEDETEEVKEEEDEEEAVDEEPTRKAPKTTKSSLKKKLVVEEEEEDTDEEAEEEDETEEAEVEAPVPAVDDTEDDEDSEKVVEKVDEEVEAEDADESEDDEDAAEPLDAGKLDESKAKKLSPVFSEAGEDDEEDETHAKAVDSKSQPDDEDADEDDETESEPSEPIERVYNRREIPAEVKKRTIVQAVNDYQAKVKTGAGAQLSKTQTRDMDKWRKEIAERRARLEKKLSHIRAEANRRKRKGQPQTPKPGPTKAMKAHTPGTEEYRERMKKILEKVNKVRRKKGLTPISETRGVKKDEMVVKKEVKKPKIAEKIPIVKRVVKMTPEEELILDASLSFTVSLKYGVFMTSDELDAKQKKALKDWLDLMTVSLPPEWGIHSLIDDINDNIDRVATSDEYLSKLLGKHKIPRTMWSKSCGGSGFACGLWKLLHTMTVGMAEHRGGLNLIESGVVDADTRTFSPLEAADTVREYLAHFFGCEECRNHFIAQYDDCSFRRCDRLTDDEEDATADDWKELSLWLWEVHNDVSVRVANTKKERSSRRGLEKGDEIKHLFPTLETCFTCFEADGTWNEDAVFEFLEQTYWSGPDPSALLRSIDSSASGSGFIWFLVFMAVAIVYMLRGQINKANLQHTLNTAMVSGRKIGGKKRSV